MEPEASFSCSQGPPRVPIVSPINSVHVPPIPFYPLFNIIFQFKTSLPCGLFRLGFSNKIGYLLLFSAVSRVQLKCDGTRWAGDGKWRWNWRMEWVASTLHATSEHGVSKITTADAHTLAASSRLNWRPRRFEWTRPFRRKKKSGFCTCAITFQTQSTKFADHLILLGSEDPKNNRWNTKTEQLQ